MNHTEKLLPLLSMELHDTLTTKDFKITRVPGGWIYSSYTGNSDSIREQSVFVPLTHEYDIRPSDKQTQ